MLDFNVLKALSNRPNSSALGRLWGMNPMVGTSLALVATANGRWLARLLRNSAAFGSLNIASMVSQRR
jgi:hypothetical protein